MPEASRADWLAGEDGAAGEAGALVGEAGDAGLVMPDSAPVPSKSMVLATADAEGVVSTVPAGACSRTT